MEVSLCMGCMREHKGGGPCPHCGFDASSYTPAAHQLPPGTILYGKYLLGKVLGEGGFGITYLGWDLNLELKVAVKEYFPNGLVTRMAGYSTTVTVLTGNQLELYEKGLERFVAEARSLARFWQMPGIVTVKDYFQANKTAYIVMEFAEGQTLKELLKNGSGRLPEDLVFDMMAPVMDALETVHAAGVIHRDISPDNLMVDAGGHVKLLDFGAAKSFVSVGEKSLSVMLKPGYAPYEQYSSRGKQGPWTDIYGLCATIYRAITGQVPLEALDRMEKDTLESPGQLGIHMDAKRERVLMKGLALIAEERFQSIREMKEALNDVGGASQGADGATFSGQDGQSDKTNAFQGSSDAAKQKSFTASKQQSFGTQTQMAPPLTFGEFLLVEIFSALILVAMLIAAAITKTGSIIFYPVIALLTAPAYMRIVTGIHKKGTILLSCVVPVVAFWIAEARILCIYLVAAGIIGEIMAAKIHWKSYKVLSMTHILYNVVYSGFIIFDYYSSEKEHYYDSPWMDILVVAMTAAAAALGTVVMRLVLKKSLAREQFIEG